MVLAGFVSDPSYRLPQMGVQPIDLPALTSPEISSWEQKSSEVF